MAAIVQEMKKSGRFTLPGFGTFTVRKTKARTALNPRTGEKVKVKAGKTVRFIGTMRSPLRLHSHDFMIVAPEATGSTFIDFFDLR